MFDFLSVGDSIKYASILIGQIDGIIDDVNDKLNSLLSDASTELTNIISKLKANYQELLETTISSLNKSLQLIFSNINTFINQVKTAIDQILDKLYEKAETLLDQLMANISQTILEMEKAASNIVITTLKGADYILDKSFDRIFLISSFLLLGVGIIVFGFYFKNGLPLKDGAYDWLSITPIFGLMAIFLGLFGSVALIKNFRHRMMKFMGLGMTERIKVAQEELEEPTLSAVVPKKITLPDTQSITVKGVDLLPKEFSPEVSIEGQIYPITASSDKELVVDIRQLDLPNGAANLRVNYPGSDFEELNAVVTIKREYPSVLSFLATEIQKGDIGTPSIAIATIQNSQDGVEANNFRVEWHSGDNGISYDETIDALKPGESIEVKFEHTYTSSGSYETAFVLDPDNRIPESNKDDNEEKETVVFIPSHFDFTLKVKHFDAIGTMGLPGPIEFEQTTFTFYLDGHNPWTWSTNKQENEALKKEQSYPNLPYGSFMNIMIDVQISYPNPTNPAVKGIANLRLVPLALVQLNSTSNPPSGKESIDTHIDFAKEHVHPSIYKLHVSLEMDPI